MLTNKWNRCDVCGRFIAYKDFEDGATRIDIQDISMDLGGNLIEHDDYETLCKKHSEKEPKNAN